MHTEQQIRPGRSFGAGSGFVKAGPMVAVALMATVLFLFIGAAHSFANSGGRADRSEDDHNPATSRAAIERFWTVYHGNDYDAIPEVQKELERAIRLDPDNPTLYVLLGATHFWHVGELTRDPNWRANQNVLAQDMPTAAGLFQKALDLDYYSQHPIGYVNDDHLPGYFGITTVHTGQELNPSLIAKGDGTLDFAAYQFPEFNNFNRWAAHLTDARDSETYQKALDSLWEGLDSCVGGTINRANPDVKPYLNLVTSVGRKKACWWKGDIAPYGFEGYMLNLGNGLVKAGQVDAARVVYANAKYADNYSTWPYRDVLEAIAASDLNARAALYAPGADSKKAPQLTVPDRSCAYCHATVPESGAR